MKPKSKNQPVIPTDRMWYVSPTTKSNNSSFVVRKAPKPQAMYSPAITAGRFGLPSQKSAINPQRNIIDEAKKRIKSQTIQSENSQNIHELYKIDAEAQAFLQQHQFLVKSLIEAIPFLERIFGKQVELQFEVDDEEKDKLVGSIWVTDSALDAIDKLKKFRDEWFFNTDDEVFEHLTFNVRFK